MILLSVLGVCVAIALTIVLLSEHTFKKYYRRMILLYVMVLSSIIYEVKSPVESGVIYHEKIWTDNIGDIILPDSGFVIKEFHYTKSTLPMAILHDDGIWKYRVLGDDE